MKIKFLKLISILGLIIIIVSIYLKLFPLFFLNYHLIQEKKIPVSYWDDLYKKMIIKDKYRVVYIAHIGGEYSYAEYFKVAAEKLGWQVRIYNTKINGNENEILEFDPDFILVTEHTYPIEDMRLIAHRSKKYIIVMPPFQLQPIKGILAKGSPKKSEQNFFRLLKSSHGVLTTCEEVGIYKKIFNKLNKNFYGIRLLPSTPSLSYQPAEPLNLMWAGMSWDTFRSSKKYRKFLELLSRNSKMKIYGYYDKLSYLSHVYDGFIPHGIENIKAIHKNGIYLLTHCDAHITYNSPSVRIFEALAANAVIISDLHPFMLENFGDTVLYFDQNADANTMYQQVKKHVDWILNNPTLAKQMASKANKIFLEKFRLEKDLIRIAKMHEYVVANEDKLSYSTVHSGY